MHTRPAWCAALVECGASALASAATPPAGAGPPEGPAEGPGTPAAGSVPPLVWLTAPALARSVVAGVAACGAVNQWAKLEGMMDAAELALRAAAARPSTASGG
jgi:hypothetical protein